MPDRLSFVGRELAVCNDAQDALGKSQLSAEEWKLWATYVNFRPELSFLLRDSDTRTAAGVLLVVSCECRQVVKPRLSSGAFQWTSQRVVSEATGVAGPPEMDLARVQRWCRARVPDRVRDQVRVEADVGGRLVTVVECRLPWDGEVGAEWTRFPVARLRYTARTGLWSLYWRDRHGCFHAYERAPATARVDDLLAELDHDPTAIFWG